MTFSQGEKACETGSLVCRIDQGWEGHRLVQGWHHPCPLFFSQWRGGLCFLFLLKRGGSRAAEIMER